MTDDELAAMRLARAVRAQQLIVGCSICGHLPIRNTATHGRPGHLVIPDELCPECRRVVDGPARRAG